MLILCEMLNVNELEEINYIDNDDLNLLDSFNQTEHDLKYDCILDAFNTQLIENPDNVLTLSDDASYTYSQIASIVNDLNSLLKQFNVSSKDTVTVFVDRNHWTIITALSCLSQGITYVPIDENHPINRVKYMIEKYNIKESADQIVEEWLQLCRDAYLSKVSLKSGVYDYLKKLHNKGVKMAFATASEKVVCEQTLKNHGIFDFFTDSAYVSEINVGKTEPDIYLLASKRIGVEPHECIVFEDIVKGIRSANKANFITCGVFDKSSAGDEDEIRSIADYYIKSFDELL